jgi:hypothetical protein
LQLERQIARCRRIASEITDEELRSSLEALAREYEAQLPKRGAGFMLQHRGSR